MENSNLPANIGNMATALAASVVAAGSPIGTDQYMKCAKGEWSYGADDTQPEEDSVWAVNPMGFQHGFISWGSKSRGNAGVMTGEYMVPATDPMPDGDLLAVVNGDWSKAVAVQLRCTNGEDEGIQAVYKTNSSGGRKAYAKLLQALVARIDGGAAKCVPLVKLGVDSYNHKEYGKIYTPEMEVVGWTDMEGMPTDEQPETLAAPEAEAAVPARRTRTAAVVEPEEEAEPIYHFDAEQAEEPAAEEPRRRRRKA